MIFLGQKQKSAANQLLLPRTSKMAPRPGPPIWLMAPHKKTMQERLVAVGFARGFLWWKRFVQWHPQVHCMIQRMQIICLRQRLQQVQDIWQYLTTLLRTFLWTPRSGFPPTRCCCGETNVLPLIATRCVFCLLMLESLIEPTNFKAWYYPQ